MPNELTEVLRLLDRLSADELEIVSLRASQLSGRRGAGKKQAVVKSPRAPKTSKRVITQPMSEAKIERIRSTGASMEDYHAAAVEYRRAQRAFLDARRPEKAGDPPRTVDSAVLERLNSAKQHYFRVQGSTPKPAKAGESKAPAPAAAEAAAGAAAGSA